MHDLSVSNSIALAKEKKVLLEQMLSLTAKQTNAIRDENFEDLEKILDEKDFLIKKIDDIDLKFKNYKSKKQIEDQELLNVLSQIDKVLCKIKTLDDVNNKKLSDAMAEMKGNLKEVRQGKRAMNNYSNSDPYQAFAAQGGTLFIDQDS